MKTLFKYILPLKWTLLLSLLMAVINQAAAYLDPMITGKIVDRYVQNFDKLSKTEYMNGIFLLVGLALAAVTIARLANNYQDYFTSMLVQKLGANMFSDGIRHSMALPYFEFEDQSSGKTLGILQKVRKDIENFITLFINVFFIGLIGLVFVLVYSFSVSYKVTLIYFVSVPLIVGMSLWLTRKIKGMQEDIMSQTANLAGVTTESLRNIELVKSMGLSDQQIDKLNDSTYSILDMELVKIKSIRRMSFIQGTLVNIVRAVMMIVLLMLIFSKDISAGQFFAFLLYSFFLFNPLQELGNVIRAWREAQVSLKQFREIIKKPTEQKPESPVELDHITKLKFDDVTFEYAANRASVKNISLEVCAGETIAFVGPSGSGKSTLIKLMTGLYAPTSGEVVFNTIAAKDFSIDDIRRKIGMVTQETQLFSGSIRENLQFIRPDCTDEECIDVLTRSACTTLLERAENNLESFIGEGGLKVSGGEKQRLSIARALLRRPDILIFDEATSALDSITEEEITKTIREISDSSELITVLIAHRLSTIKHADRIYVLEKGSVVEAGRHDELIEKNGLYYAMWRQQTSPEIAEVN
jgi:ATP-binding cassette subfamily B protein